jgi:hypothetical protein
LKKIENFFFLNSKPGGGPNLRKKIYFFPTPRGKGETLSPPFLKKIWGFLGGGGKKKNSAPQKKIF